MEVDLHPQPRTGVVGQLDRAAVDGDEAMHDGQPEPAAGRTVPGRAVGWLAPESAEGLVALGWCHPRPAVDDLPPDALLVAAGRGGGLPGAGGRLPAGGRWVVSG